MTKPIITFSLNGSPNLPPNLDRIEAGKAIFESVITFFAVTFFLVFLVWRPTANSSFTNIGLARLLFSVPPAALLAFLVFKNGLRPRNYLIHLEGRKYESGKTAAKLLNLEMKQMIKLDGNKSGISIAPGITISEGSETLGLFVLGAPGGGKSVTIKHILDQVLTRGDKCVIFDPKGDYLEMLLNRKIKFYYLAPWDKKTNGINFSEMTTEFDALEFANRIIPKPTTGSPNWALGAQSLLIGLIVTLQNKKTFWDLTDLANLINLPTSEMRELLNLYYPRGANIIATESVSTECYMSMLRTSTSPINYLAAGFKNVKKESTVSLTEWAVNENPDRKIIIIGGSKEFSTLMEICAKFTVSIISNKLCGLEDSKKRKVWFFMDEFPQIGKIPEILTLIEFGRSKGVRVLVGTQDISQLENIYSREMSNSLQSMLANRIICNMSGGVSAEAISKSLGTRTVERPNVSVNYNSQGRSTSSNFTKEISPVVPVHVITSGLGKTDTGIFALVDIRGAQSVYKIFWPFVNYNDNKKFQNMGKSDKNKAIDFQIIKAKSEIEAKKFDELQSQESQQNHQHQQHQPVQSAPEKTALIQQAEQKSETVTLTDSPVASTEADPFKEVTNSAVATALLGGEVLHVVDAISILAEGFKSPLNNNETHTHTKNKSALERLERLNLLEEEI